MLCAAFRGAGLSLKPCQLGSCIPAQAEICNGRCCNTPQPFTRHSVSSNQTFRYHNRLQNKLHTYKPESTVRRFGVQTLRKACCWSIQAAIPTQTEHAASCCCRLPQHAQLTAAIVNSHSPPAAVKLAHCCIRLNTNKRCSMTAAAADCLACQGAGSAAAAAPAAAASATWCTAC
jgi:hypothetical protein